LELVVRAEQRAERAQVVDRVDVEVDALLLQAAEVQVTAVPLAVVAREELLAERARNVRTQRQPVREPLRRRVVRRQRRRVAERLDGALDAADRLLVTRRDVPPADESALGLAHRARVAEQPTAEE